MTKNKSPEPIAIIGIGCRFPGGINNLEQYWELLQAGRDAIIDVPPDRWDIEEYYDEDPYATNKMYTKRGGFLNTNIAAFDAKFFGNSAIETKMMDPQQRLALEVTWEAIENAGIVAKDLRGSRTGVFFGVSAFDYYISEAVAGLEANAYTGTGAVHSVVAGRLSYFFGLRGPSMAIDTGCSSSLVALHQACKSLRDQETNLAIAGGVNLIMAPDASISFCRCDLLAADGVCRTFDDSASGFVRGEGAGVLLLKRLSTALVDGNKIYALIRGSAVNNNGAGEGLTIPNQTAQAEVMRLALQNADLKATDVSYIEAASTSTLMGDPVEYHAIQEVFAGGKIVLGSVKTNLGHLESASGMASIIKVVLALQHELIPKNLNFIKLNHNINSVENLQIDIPTAHRHWPKKAVKRIAGVSGFAFQGTNAHFIIEEPPESKVNLTALPPYLFQRKNYWFDSTLRKGMFANQLHPLLGYMVTSSLHEHETIFNCEFNLAVFTYLCDHEVCGTAVVPGAAYVEMVLSAVKHVLKLPLDAQVFIQQMLIEKPLVLRDASGMRQSKLVQLVIDIGLNNTNYVFKICSKTNDTVSDWVLHTHGSINVQYRQNKITSIASIESLKKQCNNTVVITDLYQQFRAISLEFGPMFQDLKQFYFGKNAALGEIILPDGVNNSEYLFHPALLDSSFQVMIGLLINNGGTIDHNITYLAFAIEQVIFHKAAEKRVWAYATIVDSAMEQIKKCNLNIYDEHGNLLLEIKEFSALKTSKEHLLNSINVQATQRHVHYEQNNSLLQKLKEVDKLQQHVLLSEHLATEIKMLLSLDPVTTLDQNASFSTMGMSSLMAVEFRNRLVKQFGTTLSKALPNTLVFNYPNLKSLTDYLLSDLLLLEVSKIEPKQVQANQTPVAIISMACRFPGAANTPKQYWDLLMSGTEAISARGDIKGGFLTDIEDFDPEYFGISAAEALIMDPQHRIMLETIVTALENAEISKNTLGDGKCSLLIGLPPSEYKQILLDAGITGDAETMSNSASGLIGRIGHYLNLKGISYSVETACSTSLVAMHLAVQSLQRGESDCVIVAVANLILSDAITKDVLKSGMLSPTFTCNSFDASANGYVRGEGCGVLILKRLPDAVKEHDQLLAIIKGSAVNQSGQGMAITAPDGIAEQAVINAAISNAGVSKESISYIEAHGTGTALGDAVELDSLREVFNGSKNSTNPLLVGCAKPNIGHLELASGMASIIKVILMLEYKMIPALLHFEKLNSYVDNSDGMIYLSQENMPWSCSGNKLLAGISCFGFGGSNAHIILEEPDLQEVSDAAAAKHKQIFCKTYPFAHKRFWPPTNLN